MLGPGDSLRDYQILAPIGAGGMASVYRARREVQGPFARDVALKVPHPHLLQDAAFVRMFLDEGNLCSRIDHPHVVRVQEIGEAEGVPFLVLELVDGCSLAELLELALAQNFVLPVDVAVQIIAAVADGLHAAHETRDERGDLLGVVHRDVSPQNVLLSRAGHVKLSDFGIAKALSTTRRTPAGALHGKLRYTAPEQLEGVTLNRQADVFALGAVLWELLAGRPLFDGATEPEVIRQIERAPIHAPEARAGSLPTVLNAVVLQALARDPKDRPESARALRSSLLEALPAAAVLDTSSVAGLVAQVLASRATLAKHAGSDLETRAPRRDEPRSQKRARLSMVAFALLSLVLIASAVIAFQSWRPVPRPASAHSTSPLGQRAAPNKDAPTRAPRAPQPAAITVRSAPLSAQTYDAGAAATPRIDPRAVRRKPQQRAIGVAPDSVPFTDQFDP